MRIPNNNQNNERMTYFFFSKFYSSFQRMRLKFWEMW